MMDDGEGGDLTCPQRRRGRGRRKSARNKRGNNSVDRSVTDHRDEITDRIRPSFRRSTRSRTGGPRVPRFVGIPRVRSAPRAQRPTRRSPLKVVSHLGARDGDGRLHPRQVSRRCQRPRALPREPARRDPRRRGAKARMVRDHVRVGWEVVPRGVVASTRAVLTEEERWPFRSREMTHLAVAAMEADVEALGGDSAFAGG